MYARDKVAFDILRKKYENSNNFAGFQTFMHSKSKKIHIKRKKIKKKFVYFTKITYLCSALW